jgi:hypothetical protein
MWKALEQRLCRNPKVRGAASEALLDALLCMERTALCSHSTELCQSGLLQGLVPLLSDNTPEARSSSRRIVCTLKVCTNGDCTTFAVLALGSPRPSCLLAAFAEADDQQCHCQAASA